MLWVTVMLIAVVIAVGKFQRGAPPPPRRALLRSLPEDSVAARTIFVSAILPIIARARHELHGDSIPLIIAGHSVGAEIALWTAANARPPGLVGVLALSPGSRGHLKISLADLAMREDNGPGSFAISDIIAAVSPQKREFCWSRRA